MLAVCIAVLPVINATSFLIQNAAALLFPEWMRLGASGMGGLEVIGQRIMGFGASLTSLSVLLAAPVIAGLGIMSVWQSQIGTPGASLLVGVAAGITVAAGEIYVAVQWLGRRFERTEIHVRPA
jgi:hypothetical protein